MIPETDPSTAAPDTAEEAAPLTVESMRATLGFSKPKAEPPAAEAPSTDEAPETPEGDEAPETAPAEDEGEGDDPKALLAPVLEGMQGILGLVQSLQAKVESLEAPKDATAPAEAPAAPVDEGAPLSFVTDETYDEVVGTPASLNNAFNAVYRAARTDALATFKAELPRLLHEERVKEETVKGESAAAANEFWGGHPADLEYIQGDERRGRRFLQEVQRAQQMHPDLAAKRDIKALYGKALESFNALRADFEAADGPKPKGGPVAPKPATVTTPSARGGLRGHVTHVDDAVEGMRKHLGLPPTQKGPNK